MCKLLPRWVSLLAVVAPADRLCGEARTADGGLAARLETILLSYDETAAAVASGTRTILYVALAGLGLLWLLLFRTV